METQRLLTGDEVAEWLGVSRSKAYAMMRQKQIPTIHMGKSVRVRVEDLEKYVLNHRETDETA